MGRSFSVPLWCALALGLGAAAPTPAQQTAELTLDNLDAWRAHILPAPAELRWEEIPWRSSFARGLLDADAQAKPLLFWAMNGHPLGCT